MGHDAVWSWGADKDSLMQIEVATTPELPSTTIFHIKEYNTSSLVTNILQDSLMQGKLPTTAFLPSTIFHTEDSTTSSTVTNTLQGSLMHIKVKTSSNLSTTTFHTEESTSSSTATKTLQDIVLNEEAPQDFLENQQAIWYIVGTFGALVLVALFIVLCVFFSQRKFGHPLTKARTQKFEVNGNNNVCLKSATCIGNNQYEPDIRPQNTAANQHESSSANDEFYDHARGKDITVRDETSPPKLEEMQQQITVGYYDEVMAPKKFSPHEEEFQYDSYFDEEETELSIIFPEVDRQTIKSTILTSSGNVELAASHIREKLGLGSQDLPNEKPNSKVVVLNYGKFPNQISDRRGAKKDSENLKQIFKYLGYSIDIHTDLSASHTEDVLRNLQMNTAYESLTIIIISHGKSRTSFYTSDGNWMDLDMIRKKFTNTACPGLKGKSKIILANFCRGTDIELQTDYAPSYVEIPRHMVTIHASVESIKALRHPRIGTIFISSLCKVLKKDQELQEMFNELEKKMRKGGGTTPMMEVFAPFPEFRF